MDPNAPLRFADMSKAEAVKVLDYLLGRGFRPTAYEVKPIETNLLGETVELAEPYTLVMDAWNELGEPFSKVVKLPDGRRGHLKARWDDPWWRRNWRRGMEKIKASSFCSGRAQTSDWIATFDWFLRPDTLTRVLEGRYDDRPTSTKRLAAQRPSQRGTGMNGADAEAERKRLEGGGQFFEGDASAEVPY